MDSSKDSENKVVNLSLRAKNYESDEEVTSSDNNLSISFDEIQDAFTDLHKESVKLAKLVSFSKKTIWNLENEVLKLNEELENLRIEVKILKPNDTNQSSTIKVIHDSKEIYNSCNCCSKSIEEIKDLKWCNPTPQGCWIEDSKKIGPEMQEKALRFSWALG